MKPIKEEVLVVLGSAGDEKHLEPCAQVLRELRVSFHVIVASAHRTPDRLVDTLKAAEASARVVIAFAGHAAHLAGSIAARVIVPVIAVPLPSSELNGLDSLLSSVQMPGGIPVATVAIGSAGSKNAAFLAAQILALKDPALQERLRQSRAQMASSIEAASAKIEVTWNP